jgi:RHS repeat-associated protein
VTRSLYDALARTTETIANYTGAMYETGNSDVATEYTYDGDNHVLTVKADEPSGGYQETQYVYGVTTAGGSGVTSNDLLAAVEYPDASTGAPSSSHEDRYTYNALGQVTSKTDRNGNVHGYSYDVLGRLTSDAVTTLGTGVNGAVRRIDYGYDTQGNLSLITSYDAASGGSVVNQVLRQFNGLGQLTAEYQNVGGAVDTSTTPAVQYAYDATTGRLTSVTYPSGYVLDYNYGSSGSLDDTISRLSSLSDSGGTLESYKYLGLDTVVERDHPQTDVNLTYISQTSSTGDAGDKYVGLDRFGRVVDQNWYNTSTTSSVDEYAYGYDRDSNRLYRENVVNSVLSELYSYDSLNQLTSFARGTLNSTKTAISGTPSATQGWGLDALGNFASVTTNGTTVTNTANQLNEYTALGSATPTYDANGNLITDEIGQQYTYDAWNRLVTVTASSTTIAAYSYDGLGRRVTETHGSTTTDLYFSAAGQVLEEQVGGVTQARNEWSPVYVNALVLRDQSSAHDGTLDQRLYVMQDANWNVTGLVDTSGAVVERYVYSPYGVVTVLAPDWSARTGSEYGFVYLFQGGRYDSATGNYHFGGYGGRDVRPATGQWLERDPLGFAAGDLNIGRFVGDSPSTYLDPSGLQVPPAGTRVMLWVLGGMMPAPKPTPPGPGATVITLPDPIGPGKPGFIIHVPKPYKVTEIFLQSITVNGNDAPAGVQKLANALTQINDIGTFKQRIKELAKLVGIFDENAASKIREALPYINGEADLDSRDIPDGYEKGPGISGAGKNPSKVVIKLDGYTITIPGKDITIVITGSITIDTRCLRYATLQKK